MVAVLVAAFSMVATGVALLRREADLEHQYHAEALNVEA
jgi:hypothetical protein